MGLPDFRFDHLAVFVVPIDGAPSQGDCPMTVEDEARKVPSACVKVPSFTERILGCGSATVRGKTSASSGESIAPQKDTEAVTDLERHLIR